MKLQVKVTGETESYMSTPNSAKIVGKLGTIDLYNNVCNDVFIPVNGKYQGIVLKGKGIEVYEINGDIIVIGDITDIQFTNEKGQVVKSYYIPECIIQLIDEDEEPDEDFF